MLKRSAQLKELHKDFQRHYEWNSISRFKYSPQYFDIVKEIEKRECQGEFISYGKKQALMYLSEHVITSYSIHYTKLYDSIHDGRCTVSIRVKKQYEKLVFDINNPSGDYIFDEKRANKPIDFIA